MSSVHLSPYLPPSVPSFERRKDLTLAVGTLAFGVILLAILGAAGDYKEIPFRATMIASGSILLLSVGAFFIVVRAEKKERFSSQIRQQILAFAREELRKAGNVPLYKWGVEIFAEPISPGNEVLQLATLYYDSVAKLQNTLKTKSWRDREIVALAEKIMKIGFAIDLLILEALPSTIAQLQARGGVIERATPACAWRQCNSNFIGHIGYSTRFYRFVRASCSYNERRIQFMTFLEGRVNTNDKFLFQLFDYPATIAHDYSTLFYQKDTPQSFLRILNNEMCEMFSLYFPKRDLKKEAIENIIHFYQKDESPSSYVMKPKD